MKPQLLKPLLNLVPRTQAKENRHHHHQHHQQKPKRDESQEEEKPVLRRERTFEIDPKMSIRQVTQIRKAYIFNCVFCKFVVFGVI